MQEEEELVQVGARLVCFSVFIVKLPLSAECSPEAECSVMFAVTCPVCTFWAQNIQLQKLCAAIHTIMLSEMTNALQISFTLN